MRLLSDAGAERLSAHARSDAGVVEALSRAPSAGAPMSPRVASYAAAYLLAVADGAASEHEIGWLLHFIDRLAPLDGEPPLTEADRDRVAVAIIAARKKPDALLADIAASLPRRTQRAGALYLACIVALLDGVRYDSETAALERLRAALALDRKEIDEMLAGARALIASL
jgi:tellurite resistance protein